MDVNKTVRLAGIAYESLVNGPGIRRVLFSQGCSHNCKECFNPDTHSYNGGETFCLDELIRDIKNNPMLKGLTFSGGDPLEQADKFAYIAQQVKEKGLNIYEK
jgi:anaerobic ribonucleoside-triphosphate reductase activating protein